MLDKEEQAAASLAEAALLGEENGVRVEPVTVRARSIGQRDRRPGQGARRRSDRARLVAALAPAVGVLLADRRLRAPPRAVRGARRRVPAGRPRGGRCGYAEIVNVIIGCGSGRVGSSIAKLLQPEGWDVTVIDEKEEALSPARRELARGLRGRARHGHRDPRTRGSRGRRRRRRRDERGQHEHRHRPGREEALRDRLRRRARARSRRARSSTPSSGMHTVCPTQTAISALTDAVRASQASSEVTALMYVIVAGGGKVGANVARSLLADAPRGDADRADAATATSGSRPSSSTRCCSGTRPSCTCSSAPGSRDRPTSSSRSRATTRTTSIICQIAREGYDVPEGDRARERSAQPGALRPARDHPDRLRDLRTSSASSSTRCPSTELVHLLELRRKTSRSSRSRSRPGLAVRGQADRRPGACRMARA